MTSFVSSLESNKQQSALNTCLKSLNNMIDYHKFDEEEQDFVELYYNGPVSEISKIEIRHPKKKGSTIPILAHIASSIPVIVGYTDGTSVDISPTFTSQLSSKSSETYSEVETVDIKGDDNVKKTEGEVRYKNGLVVEETTYITTLFTEKEVPDPTEEDPEHTKTVVTKTVTYQIYRTFDYNKSNITVFQRF